MTVLVAGFSNSNKPLSNGVTDHCWYISCNSTGQQYLKTTSECTEDHCNTICYSITGSQETGKLIIWAGVTTPTLPPVTTKSQSLVNNNQLVNKYSSKCFGDTVCREQAWTERCRLKSMKGKYYEIMSVPGKYFLLQKNRNLRAEDS